ncbi:GlsB/YeaQ/YmgE family stress response membrane protein [Candidatus Parcubacteria bacterium]|nr:MAG: GlsB/YeaQ/YmgE family stress response membrane protein [Candidatus Parcubacteria bacterium]
MNILTWILFGLIVGVIANFLDPRPSRGGIFGAIILGIVGALLGGFLSNFLFGIPLTGFDIRSLIIAVIGALILLFAGRTFQRQT